jgi:hypothetical protein
VFWFSPPLRESGTRAGDHRLLAEVLVSAGSNGDAHALARSARAHTDRERSWALHQSSRCRVVLLSAELIAGDIGADRSGSVRDGACVAIKFADSGEVV